MHNALDWRKVLEPIMARYWRITIVATPAVVQRLAEAELYTDPVSMMDLDADLDADEGLGL